MTNTFTSCGDFGEYLRNKYELTEDDLLVFVLTVLREAIDQKMPESNTAQVITILAKHYNIAREQADILKMCQLAAQMREDPVLAQKAWRLLRDRFQDETAKETQHTVAEMAGRLEEAIDDGEIKG